MATIEMTAHHLSTHYDAENAGRVQDVWFLARLATADEATALAASFPRSVRARAVGATVRLEIALRANGANGGVNETGLRRYATFRRVAAKLGPEVVYVPGNAVNAFRTAADFEAVAGIA